MIPVGSRVSVAHLRFLPQQEMLMLSVDHRLTPHDRCFNKKEKKRIAHATGTQMAKPSFTCRDDRFSYFHIPQAISYCTTTGSVRRVNHATAERRSKNLLVEMGHTRYPLHYLNINLSGLLFNYTHYTKFTFSSMDNNNACIDP